MTPKTKKIVIVALPIIVAIIILSLAILYFTTDFLKSNEKLFLKYMSQNVEAFKMISDNKSEKEYTNLLKQNKYTSTTELNATYTENISTSEEKKDNDINKLKLVINSQSEYLNNYSYKDINVNYNDSNLLRAEYIHENEKYGIRFPNKFNQFLAVENHDLKQIATNSGFTEEQVGIIPENIQEYDYNGVFNFTDDEIETLKNSYTNLINSNVSSDRYSKQKDVMITIGENSIYTNAYSLTLTQEQANDLYIKILQQLKDDEIIINKLSQVEPIGTIINLIRKDEGAYNSQYLGDNYKELIEQKIHDIEQNNIGTEEVTYTVYQMRGNTVRTQIEEKSRQITIDLNITDNDNIEVDIEDKNNNQEQEDQQTIKIIKDNNEEENDFSIVTEKILGEKISGLFIYRNKKISENEVDVQTGINYNDGQNNLLEAKLIEKVSLNQETQEKIELNDENSVTLNDYKEELVTKWVNAVKEYLNQTVKNNQTIIKNIEKVDIIKKLLNIPDEVVQVETTETTEIDKNKFNAKFEFYTGKEKKGEEVKKLLEEAKTSLKNAQVSYSNEGYTEGTKKLQSIKLIVEKDANKAELADSVKEMIEDTKSYTVEIEKNTNDIVTAIIITVNK